MHTTSASLSDRVSAPTEYDRDPILRDCRIGTTHSTDDRWFPLHECLRFIEIALCTPPRPHAPSDTACPSMGPCGVGRARCTLCLPRLLSGSALLTRRALSGSVWPCGVGGSVLALLRFRLLFLFLLHFFFFSFAHLRSLSVPTPSRYPVLHRVSLIASGRVQAVGARARRTSVVAVGCGA